MIGVLVRRYQRWRQDMRIRRLTRWHLAQPPKNCLVCGGEVLPFHYDQHIREHMEEGRL